MDVDQLQPDTCLIIPCYNEANRLDAELIKQFSTTHPQTDILFVNDGSTDDTSKLLQALSDLCGNISYLDMPCNSGKAEAVRSGFMHAIPKDYLYIGYFDADFSTPLHEADTLKRVLSDNESINIAIGSRVKMLGYDIQRSLLRHLAGRVFATMASVTLKLPVYDTQCGAKLFVNNKYLHILFCERFINKWTFDLEIIKRHLILTELEQQSRHQIEEVPLRIWKDVAGSKVRPVDFFIAIKDLISISHHYSNKRTIERFNSLLQNYSKNTDPCSH